MGYLKKIIYNCKQATYLIEKKGVAGLSFRDAIELRIHLFGCSFCRIFNRQSHIINNMVHQLLKSNEPPNIKLHENFKKELQERIEEELNK